MSLIARTLASLRYSDKHSDAPLVPDELTAALGRPPTRSWLRGEIRRNARGEVMKGKNGVPLVCAFNAWYLEAEPREPGDLDGQIREIFGPLTNDLAIWRGLSRYRPDLFVGVFMEEFNEGIDISAECLAILGERGVVLALDVYGATDPSDETLEAPLSALHFGLSAAVRRGGGAPLGRPSCAPGARTPGNRPFPSREPSC